jgi:hypothetical protein
MKQPKEFDYFKAWLIIFIVATAGGTIVGIAIGSLVTAFLGAGKMPSPQVTRILQVLGFVIGIPISYGTFRIVVGKYLLPKTGDNSLPRTNS